MGAFEDAINLIRHAVYGEEVREGIASALELSMNTQQSVAGKEDSSNKVTTVNSNSTDIEYPSAKAVYDALKNKLSSAAGAVKTANIDTGAVTEVKLAAAFKNTLYKVNTTDQQPNYETCDAKTIYVGAKLGNERGIIIPFFGKDKQMFIGVYGTICVRHYTGGNDYQDWEPNLSELTANKKASITSNNQSSTDFFPSIKAVVDYLTENYTNTTALNKLLNRKADYTYVDSRLGSKADTSYVDSRLGSKAETSYVDNRLNTKADSSALTAKENLSNKITTGENLLTNKNSIDKYPAAKAIVDYIAALFATVINNDNKHSK